jgi:CRP-like cAMP-binding protein
MREESTFLNETDEVVSLSVRNFQSQFYGWGPPRKRPPGTTIYVQGGTGEWIHYIEQGLIKLTVTESEGNEYIVALRRKGWLLAVSAVILQESHLVTATTLTPCTLRSIRQEKFLEQLRKNIGLSLTINRMLCREIKYNIKRLSHLNRRDAMDRIEGLLVELILEEKDGGNGSFLPIEVPLRNTEIAQIVGATAEHTSRLLRKLEDRGLVQRERSCLMILRPQDFLLNVGTA